LLKVAKVLETLSFDDEDENIAIEIVKNAIQYPVIQIANNAGYK
jgi:chaperonin GroEL (HSP60 family)